MSDVYSPFDQADATVPPKWNKIILVDTVTGGDVEITVASGVVVATSL